MEDLDALAIERVRAGDADSFRSLVERHGRGVYRLAFRMVGNQWDAEDVVQETFVRAYKQIASYESRSNFGTWLNRIATNYSLDLIRARKRHEIRRVRPMGDDGVDPIDAARCGSPGQERLLLSKETKARISATLAAMSDQERCAFLLRHCEGQSIEEIGVALGTATSATKNSIFRAVRKLREALGETASAKASGWSG